MLKAWFEKKTHMEIIERQNSFCIHNYIFVKLYSMMRSFKLCLCLTMARCFPETCDIQVLLWTDHLQNTISHVFQNWILDKNEDLVYLEEPWSVISWKKGTLLLLLSFFFFLLHYYPRSPEFFNQPFCFMSFAV